MTKKTYITRTDNETKSLAKSIIQDHLTLAHFKPLVLLLYGQLGAGKTTFVKGVGEALGANHVSSPTFVLIHEYVLFGSIKKFFHIDLYRVVEKSEFLYLGIEDGLLPDTITCIEWSEHAGPIMKFLESSAYIIKIKINNLKEMERKIEVTTE